MEDHGQNNARGWLSTIVEAVAAYKALNRGDVTAESDGETFDDADALRERLQEGPLSVLVRGDWYAPGSDRTDVEAEEFEILLTTGGPALRIRGEIGLYCAPEAPRLQYQEWGAPWTDLALTKEEREALATYCGFFYFGE